MLRHEPALLPFQSNHFLSKDGGADKSGSLRTSSVVPAASSRARSPSLSPGYRSFPATVPPTRRGLFAKHKLQIAGKSWSESVGVDTSVPPQQKPRSASRQRKSLLDTSARHGTSLAVRVVIVCYLHRRETIYSCFRLDSAFRVRILPTVVIQVKL